VPLKRLGPSRYQAGVQQVPAGTRQAPSRSQQVPGRCPAGPTRCQAGAQQVSGWSMVCPIELVIYGCACFVLLGSESEEEQSDAQTWN